MSTDYKFFGWVGKDKESIGNLVWEEYQPKKWEENDVDIKVSHCGICASDLHTLRSGWGPSMYPQVVGHEIVGKVVKVGKDVKHLKLGDRVGVGAQSGSCLNCGNCKEGKESYCDNGMTGTYNGKFPCGDKSFGGYAEYSRVPAHFAFKIPDGIPSEIAAPMLCGGITVYSPLKQLGAGPGKRIGVVGIGGLGHFALLFAKALGAEVVAISHSSSKKADAEKMGVSQFIATKDSDDWDQKNRRTLDGIVVTANNADMPIAKYAGLLKTGHKMILVGVPEEPISVNIFSIAMNNVSLAGSLIGGSKEITEMLEVAAKTPVKSWIEVRDMKDANQATVDMEDGKARYRYVLANKNF